VTWSGLTGDSVGQTQTVEATSSRCQVAFDFVHLAVNNDGASGVARIVLRSSFHSPALFAGLPLYSAHVL
jgi:hypothetical protein